jgi:hypothetical protein
VSVVAGYAAPTWPPGSKVVVIVTLPAAAIVSVRLVLLLCAGLLESVTWIVSSTALTAAVGVPEIKPVDAARVSPEGSGPLVTDQVYGALPPLAVRVVVYGVPTWPLGSEAVVMAIAATGGVPPPVPPPEALPLLEHPWRSKATEGMSIRPSRNRRNKPLGACIVSVFSVWARRGEPAG